MDYNEDQTAMEIDTDSPIVSTVIEVPAARLRRPSSPRMHSMNASDLLEHAGSQRYAQYSGTKATIDARIRGSTWTNVKPEIDIPDRHELFLLADGERKIEMETVTRKSMRRKRRLYADR